MENVENDVIERVVTSEVSRISRSVRDFSATVERIVDECGVALHILDMSIDLDPDESDPYTRAFLQVAATFAELEAEIKRQNTREGIARRRAVDHSVRTGTVAPDVPDPTDITISYEPDIE